MSMHAQFKHQLTPAIRHKALAHPMFDALSDDEVELIFTLVSYGALHEGDRIFKEGDPGNQCYFMLSGAVEVTKRLGEGEETLLATLKAGDLFGEIALIDRKPRSASCRVARGGAELLSLSTDSFERLFSAQSSFAYKVLDRVVIDLSKRLRGATAELQRAQLAPDAAQRNTLSLRAAQLLTSAHSSHNPRAEVR